MSDIKENLNNLLDENASKELIEKVAVLQNQVDELIANSQKQADEYKDLLKDYAKVIQHSTYKVDNPQLEDTGRKQFDPDAVWSNWLKQNGRN